MRAGSAGRARRCSRQSVVGAVAVLATTCMMAFGSPCRAAPPEEALERRPSGVTAQRLVPPPAPPTAGAMRVPTDVPEKLAAARGREPIVLVEGLSGQLPREAVAVSVVDGAGGIVGGRVEPAGNGKGWELWTGEKRLARLRQKDDALLLEPADETASQLEHLVLEVRPTAGGQAARVRLGRPPAALLQLRLLRAKESRAGGGATKKSTASIPRTGRFSLFDEPAVNATISRIAETYPDLVERLEFGDGLGSRSRMADRNGRRTPSFTVTDAGGRGVELRRSSTKPLEYQWSGLVFPLRYAQFNKQYADTRVFDERLLDEIPVRLKIDLDRLSESYRYDDREVHAKLVEAATIDKQSMDAADAFPIESLQGRPVRLTLGRPGESGGFVLVDSLDRSPEGERAVSSPARTIP